MAPMTESWRAEMPEKLSPRENPEYIVWANFECLVERELTRANAELDAKDAELTTLRELVNVQSARILQLVAECKRLARDETYQLPGFDGTEAEKLHARIASLEFQLRAATEWRPMSEAPRDGLERVLLRGRLGQVDVYVWEWCNLDAYLGWLPLPEVKP